MGGTPFPGDGFPGVISSRAIFSGTAFGPGLSTPLMVLPSWSITTTIRLWTVAVGPQWPSHVPFAGCPSWASAETAHSSTDRTQIRRNALADMLVPREGLRSIVLAVVGRQIIGHPLKGPRGLPRPRIGARVVDRDLVSQRVVITAGEALDEVQQVGMWQPATGEPELVDERLGI